MASGIPLDAGALMSTVLEGVLYGFSILLFIGTIWSLTYKRHKQDINLPILVVAVLLLILSTAHMVVNIVRAEDGLVINRYEYPNGPSEYFADVSQETYVIKHSFYVLQTLLADGVVIYRCYVVWQSVWIVVLPIILWCSVAVTGVIAVYSVSQAGSGDGIFVKALAQWVTAFFASTIATNLLSSGLLAYRIWIIQRGVSGVNTSRNTVMPVVRVLVDAAILYSAALLTALILFVSGNNGQDAVVDMAMPIMSIAFYMVLIRIALNKKEHSYVSTRTSASIPRRAVTSEAEQERAQQYAMKPLQVHVSKFTHQERPSSSKDSMRGTSPPYDV
ncbi:uncharacterized protein HD556DRAFT_1232772 [Suillus plorans]|uniref:Uncharacterized protein n=1 Tax=Suillus plorans TaxID=116603 RepID=A0A9P7J0E8_9AGAM|nr:uncharacterized protein HD556DRAFT_1232772 [Suillus plorans]KAG1798256.1 hypothetical protein HD556DRAFT_1232772 [Suillus plorans]